LEKFSGKVGLFADLGEIRKSDETGDYPRLREVGW